MTSPVLRMILWTTEKVWWGTVMKVVPKPTKTVEGAHQRFVEADADFLRIAIKADLTSYQIAETLAIHYVHPPLCPLPAELSYLMPIFTWRCLAMVYQHVRLMVAERRDIDDIVDPGLLSLELFRENLYDDLDEDFYDGALINEFRFAG